jgi:hypothetical protein
MSKKTKTQVSSSGLAFAPPASKPLSQTRSGVATRSATRASIAAKSQEKAPAAEIVTSKLLPEACLTPPPSPDPPPSSDRPLTSERLLNDAAMGRARIPNQPLLTRPRTIGPGPEL